VSATEALSRRAPTRNFMDPQLWKRAMKRLFAGDAQR